MISGSIILEYISKSGLEYVNSAAGFEYAGIETTPESGHIRVHYLNDENFLYDDANGFFLSGEPTAKIGALIENLEKINKSNWGHVVADETMLDSKDIRSGFERVFSTFFDVSGETNSYVRCGIGSGDDLQLVRLVTFDPNDVLGPGLFTISGELLSGTLREQGIEHDNIYNFAPEINHGYLYLNSGEIYLYGSKVTELYSDNVSGTTISGIPNDYSPMTIRLADFDSLDLGCISGTVPDYGYFESDQYNNHYTEQWGNNLSPASPFHIINMAELARVYISGNEIIEREMSETAISVDHFVNSGVVTTFSSGDLTITYEENGKNTCTFPDVDLSPLTWDDGDRILAVQPFEKDPSTIMGYITQPIIQPIVTTVEVSGDSNLVNVIANVRDEDGVPIAGAVVLFDLTYDLFNISGESVSSTQYIDEDSIISFPLGNVVSSIEHKFDITPVADEYIFDSFNVGLFNVTPTVTTYASPARAYIDNGTLSLTSYVETDAFGSAICPIHIHNFNNYTTENILKLSISGQPLVSSEVSFRILSIGTSIDGYVETIDDYTIPNHIQKYQYVSFSGSTEIELEAYPIGGAQMVELYNVSDFYNAWGPVDPQTPLVATDRGDELWYDGTGVAHVSFSTSMSGGFIGWNKMLSHTTDFVGVTYP